MFASEIVRIHLDRVLTSRSFGHARRLRRILLRMVEAVLSGEQDLSEYSIGVDALQKPDTFDPRADPSVRVLVHRLRLKLQNYYESDGRADAVVIDLPPRTYMPVFRLRAQVPAARGASDAGAALPSEIRLAILPFVSLSTCPKDSNFADGLTQEVIHALMRRPQLQVIVCERRVGAVFTDALEVGRRANAGAVLQGTVRIAEPQVRICAELVNVHDGSLFWSNMYENTVRADHPFATQEAAAESIGRAVHISVAAEAACALLRARPSPTPAEKP